MTLGNEVQESEPKYCGWYEQFVPSLLLARVSADTRTGHRTVRDVPI
jgi:hypothetical protein